MTHEINEHNMFWIVSLKTFRSYIEFINFLKVEFIVIPEPFCLSFPNYCCRLQKKLQRGNSIRPSLL